MGRFKLGSIKTVRWGWCLWAAGLTVWAAGNLAATFITHSAEQRLECSVISVALYLPMLVGGLIRIHRTKKEIEELNTRLIVLDTIHELVDPSYHLEKLRKDAERISK